MMVSTKGRYALRIMIDLAQHYDGGYVSLSDIAKRQYASLKYLEAIVSVLNKAGFVESLRGKDGGYRLTRDPKEYTIGSILKLTEGSLAPISCSEFGSAGGPGLRTGWELHHVPHVAAPGRDHRWLSGTHHTFRPHHWQCMTCWP